MKKSFVLSALVALSAGFVSFAETTPLIVPKTNEGSLLALPLAEGQMGYAENDEVSASLYIGDPSAKDPMIVADPFTLRGYKEEEIKFGEYVVTHTAGITYNAADNSWTVNHNNTGVTERVIFRLGDSRKISNVEYDAVNEWSVGVGTQKAGTIDVKIEGNVVTFNMTKTEPNFGGINNMKIYDVVLFYAPYGASHDVNDLTALHIPLIDTVGPVELGKMRETLMKYDDSHDHADKWYKYDGSNDVTMTFKDLSDMDKNSTNKAEVISRNRAANYGNGFWFDGPGMNLHLYKLYMDTISTNLCVKAGNLIPMEVSFRGTDTNNFKITSFAHDAKTHTTKLFLSSAIESFSVSNLKVYWTDELKTNETVWTQFPSSAYVFSEGNILIPNRTNPMEFYKIDYQASSITPPHSIIYLRGEVIMEDGMKVKDFNHVWQASDNKALSVYIDEKVAAKVTTDVIPVINNATHADISSASSATVTASNGKIINASIGAGPLNITVPAPYASGKSDSFTIRITCSSNTQLGTVQGPSGEAVTLEWLTDPLTTAGSIHASKSMYLTMTRVDTWTFICRAEEVK